MNTSLQNFWKCILLVCIVSLASCNGDNEKTDPDKQQIFIGDNIAIASTQYGKVKGYICRDIYTFLGIPYGANTGGENRFMPPKPPEPWKGIKPTVYYGNSAPQRETVFNPESYGTWQDAWNYTNLGEDCLRLNVWTPALDEAKRPVIVWLHGGGFSSGNAIEQDGYGGENFARQQNAVFCSINHRLNCFGFSDLASVGGEKYKHSGNVGMLDIVFALQWVHDNIANFGGDPGNVTIIGQSGGGSKVCIVAAMPSAKGLVHKAVALSGNSIRMTKKSDAEKLGEYILKEAKLKPAEIDTLQKMPWKEYMDLANKATASLRRDNTGGPTPVRAGFNPVGDGIDIPEGVFYSEENAGSPDIPMLICSTFHEFNGAKERPEQDTLSKNGIIKQLSQEVGDSSKIIYEGYEKIMPGLKPADILAAIRTSSSREGVVNTANAKLKQKSPVYVAWFGWIPPMFDGRQRAFHCIDICFWFNNTDVMLTHTGGGKVPRLLSDKMGASLAAFMRTGNPNTGKAKGLPEWPQYTEKDGAVMILGNQSRVMNDPDRPLRAMMPARNRRGL